MHENCIWIQLNGRSKFHLQATKRKRSKEKNNNRNDSMARTFITAENRDARIDNFD